MTTNESNRSERMARLLAEFKALAAEESAEHEPQTSADYERLLSLIVCVCPRDRFRAMDKLKSDGIAAAIGFLGGCTLTDENYESESIAQDRIDAAQLKTYQAIDLLYAAIACTERENEAPIVANTAARAIAEVVRAARALLSDVTVLHDEAASPRKGGEQ